MKLAPHVAAGIAASARSWVRLAVMRYGRLVMRRKKLEARPNGVVPRAPVVHGRSIAWQAHNDNGGTAAVRFGRAGTTPLVGSYRTVGWHVAIVGQSRAATAAR